MTAVNIDKWADRLFDAEKRNEAVTPITDAEPNLTVDEAYEIQDALVARRVAAGERIVGVKLGLTSRAKQKDMGIAEPIYAWLTDAMLLRYQAPLRLDDMIHPRIEPEIVFVMGDSLAGPGVGVQEVLAATAAVCCGMEIIDSRFVNFRFGLADVVADNASACRFVLGTARVPPTDIDLPLLGCLLDDDGEQIATAAGAAIMGHPAAAVAELANFIGRRGRCLEPGWIVLSGGMTAAHPLVAGHHVSANFAHLGRVDLKVNE